MEILCAIHGTEMKQYWKKDDPNHQGLSWFSHKDDQGNWCNGKTPRGPSTGMSQPFKAKTIAEYEGDKPDWDKIAVGKVASNIATALIQSGKPVSDVQAHLTEIFKLANNIVNPPVDDNEIPF